MPVQSLAGVPHPWGLGLTPDQRFPAERAAPAGEAVLAQDADHAVPAELAVPAVPAEHAELAGRAAAADHAE